MDPQTKTPGSGNRTRYLTSAGAWVLAFGCSVGWGAFVMPGNTFLPLAEPAGSAAGLALGALVILIIAALCGIFTGLIGDYIALSRLLVSLEEDRLLPGKLFARDGERAPRKAIMTRS